MPAAGLEPARRCRQQILSLPRLPIPTRRLVLSNEYYNNILSRIVQAFFNNFENFFCARMFERTFFFFFHLLFYYPFYKISHSTFSAIMIRYEVCYRNHLLYCIFWTSDYSPSLFNQSHAWKIIHIVTNIGNFMHRPVIMTGIIPLGIAIS